ncbi:MAG: peptidoglycan-binding protein, partial [Thermoflexus sp.]
MPTETPLLVLPTPAMPQGAPTPTPPLSPLPSPTPVPVAPQPTPAPSAKTVTHVVQPGETLFRIAMRYGTTVEAI